MDVQQETYAEGRASVIEQRSPLHTERRRRAASALQRRTTLSEPRRFLALLLGAHGCICASAGYLYNLFSGQLQQKYDYTQKQMTTITTTASILGVMTFPLAMVYDYYGPRPAYLIGTAAFPLGALLLAFTLNDTIEGSVSRITVYMTLLGVGTSMFDLASLMTVMAIFPSSRGAVIAVMKTFIGLGAAIFGVVQVGFFDGNIVGFLCFTAAYVALVGLLCSVFVSLPPYQLTTHEERCVTTEERVRREALKRPYLEQIPPARRFAIGFAIVAVLIVYLPLQSLLVTFTKLSCSARVALAVVAVLLVAAYTIIALPLQWLDAVSTSPSHDDTVDEDDVNDRYHAAAAVLGEYNAAGSDVNTDNHVQERSTAALHATWTHNNSVPTSYTSPYDEQSPHLPHTRASIVESAVFTPQSADEVLYMAPQYQTTFRQSLATPQLWLFVYTLFCIYGAQGVVISNARFIYGAIAEHDINTDLAALLTIVIGAGSAIGRVAISVFEIWTQKRPPQQRIPLTIVMHIPTMTMLLSSTLLLIVPPSMLLVPFVLTALGNGFTAASVVLVMRTIYAKDIGNHYAFISVSSVLSSLLLNQLLYGEYYTREAATQNSTTCYGRCCIRVPFVIISLLVASSIASNAYVHTRYKAYIYASMLQQQQHIRREEGDNANNETHTNTQRKRYIQNREGSVENDDMNERQTLLAT